MQTVTLNLSILELQTMRRALADFATISYRQAKVCTGLGMPREARAWSAHEVAAVDVLSRLPAVQAMALAKRDAA